MGPHSKIDKESILNCYESKKIKVVDLTEVLSKFSELFSITPLAPESNKSLDIDPNDAVLPPPSFPGKKFDSTSSFSKPKIVIPKSPFANSEIAEDPTIRGWYYIDEADIIQGPFTALEMDNWFDQGYLFNELLIKFGNDMQFQSLVDVFGKLEYPGREHFPITRKVERRATMRDEDLPSLNFAKTFSYNENVQQQQTMQFRRGVHRFSYEESSDVLTRNFLQTFIDKKPEENVTGKPTELLDKKQEIHTQEVPKPKSQEADKSKAQAETASKPKTEVQKEEKEVVDQKPLNIQEEAPKEAKKLSKTEDQKYVEKKTELSAQESNLKMDQTFTKKESDSKAKKTAHKGESEGVKETQHADSGPMEEKKATKAHKKPQKSPKNQHLLESKEQVTEQKATHHGQASTRDKRYGKGKYFTVFEPKIESQELKDKAQESHPKEDTKYAVGAKNNSSSKNASFFEGDASHHKSEPHKKGTSKMHHH